MSSEPHAVAGTRRRVLARALPGVVLVALGSTVLVGWWRDEPALRSIVSGFGEMKANTAVAFVLAGLALLVVDVPRLVSPRRALAAVVALVGVATLAEYATGHHLGIDQLLVADPGGAGNARAPGRMGVNTAFDFAVAGSALVALGRERARAVAAQVAAGVVLCVAYVALLGYAFGIPRLQAGGVSPQITPMAILTAAGFVVLALGLLLVDPDVGATRLARSRGAGGVLIGHLLPAAVLAPTAIGWLRLEGERHGLYGPVVGLVLYATAMTTVFAALVLRTAAALEAADQARRESAAREAAMIASALDAIIAIDDQGIMLEFNAAAERLFGYRRDEAVGSRLEDRVVPPALRGAHRAGFERYVATGTAAALLQARVAVPAVRKDGSEFHAELAVTENTIGGRSIFTAFFRDVSERTAAEAERKSLEAQLRQSQKMEAVGRLAGGVAHDFNNLLTVIGGHAELLLQRLDEDDPRRTHAVQVGRAGDKAAALTRRLLAISRRQVLDARVVALNEVVADVAPMLERILGEDVTLELRLDPALGRIRADPDQLDHMLLNLAVNARDAMPEGGRLTVETRNAQVDDGAGACVALVVADTGSGMDEDVREHVFEPFFTTKPTGQGTGLGLATVHGIVTQSGGSVRVESAPGAGTTFTILLPQAAAGDEAEVASRRAPDRELATGVRETILLVEDDGEVRALTRQLLEGCGYRVLTASDGRAALTIWSQWGRAIDLVLTDVMMPGVSGLDLRRQLRAEHPGVKVLCMSGYSERLARGAEGDDVEFIAKPFTAVALAGRVRTLLDGDPAGSSVTDPAARA